LAGVISPAGKCLSGKRGYGPRLEESGVWALILKTGATRHALAEVVTLTKTGFYDITAYGAEGGSSLQGAIGDFGAAYGGNSFFLQANDKLEIIVGTQGQPGPYTGGGGGGTSYS
jgi:hypothetical protein